MNFAEAMQSLEQAGSAQFRKTYARHGIAEPMFGVRSAHLKTMVKKIKTDHALAEQLWANGNYDARVLATMIADPQQATAALLDQWVQDLDSYPIVDAFANFAARTKFAKKRAITWTCRKQNEWLVSAGWALISRLALDDQQLNDDFFLDFLVAIEDDIHRSKNRVRHSMNGALIAIGLRNEELTKEALDTARRIGKVEVDHGDTACQTPDAAAYIQRSLARKKK